MEQQSRRGLLKNAAIAAAAVGSAAVLSETASAKSKMEKKSYPPPKPGDTPLFSSAVSYGNLLFLAGVGAHFEGTIEEHTKHVLDELEKNLTAAGSSMDKVLKVNVYLTDMKQFAEMNAVYAKHFVDPYPARTTIAVLELPLGAAIEIEMIAS